MRGGGEGIQCDLLHLRTFRKPMYLSKLLENQETTAILFCYGNYCSIGLTEAATGKGSSGELGGNVVGMVLEGGGLMNFSAGSLVLIDVLNKGI